MCSVRFVSTQRRVVLSNIYVIEGDQETRNDTRTCSTFGKLEYKADWWTFSEADWIILSVDCLTDTHNTHDYS